MIRLERAFLCIDEDLIYDGGLSMGCPQCGSRNVASIARWLNRKPGAYDVTAAGRAALAEPR